VGAGGVVGGQDLHRAADLTLGELLRRDHDRRLGGQSRPRAAGPMFSVVPQRLP
jgi:hypothetical protein